MSEFSFLTNPSIKLNKKITKYALICLTKFGYNIPPFNTNKPLGVCIFGNCHNQYTIGFAESSLFCCKNHELGNFDETKYMYSRTHSNKCNLILDFINRKRTELGLTRIIPKFSSTPVDNSIESDTSDLDESIDVDDVDDDIIYATRSRGIKRSIQQPRSNAKRICVQHNENTPVKKVSSVENTHVESIHIENTHVENTHVGNVSVEKVSSAENTSVENAPVENTPVETVPVEKVSNDSNALIIQTLDKSNRVLSVQLKTITVEKQVQEQEINQLKAEVEKEKQEQNKLKESIEEEKRKQKGLKDSLEREIQKLKTQLNTQLKNSLAVSYVSSNNFELITPNANKQLNELSEVKKELLEKLSELVKLKETLSLQSSELLQTQGEMLKLKNTVLSLQNMQSDLLKTKNELLSSKDDLSRYKQHYQHYYTLCGITMQNLKIVHAEKDRITRILEAFTAIAKASNTNLNCAGCNEYEHYIHTILINIIQSNKVSDETISLLNEIKTLIQKKIEQSQPSVSPVPVSSIPVSSQTISIPSTSLSSKVQTELYGLLNELRHLSQKNPGSITTKN